MQPFKMTRPASKVALWKEAQKFGPTLSLYTREDGANQNYLYFVLKSYKEGTEANMDVEGEDGTGKGGFISFLEGSKEDNFISGQITAGQQPAGKYPLFLDTCFDPERGIAISGGFASYIIWAFAYDFDRRESVLLNPERQIILSETELGELVVKSHLKELGKLDYLNVGGEVVIDAGLTVNGTTVLKGVLADSIFATNYYNLPPLDPTQLTPLTLDATNFRVGISNPLPQHALDVSGDVNVSGQFLVNGQPVTTDLAPLTLDKPNNRVGINKTVPGSALDVVGDGRFTGVLEAEGMALRDAGLLVAGTSILGQTDILSNLEVTGNTTLAGNLDVQGAVGIDSDLSVIGNTFLFNADVLDKVKAYKFFSGAISIVGGVGNPEGVETADAGSLFMSSSGVLYVKTGTGNTGWVALASGTTPSDLLPITLDKPNNRVGINNATPAYTLGVGGDANLSTGGTYRINTFPAVAARASDTTIALGRTNDVPDASTNAVAIGYAANVGASSISIGNNAGATTQGTGSVAIGQDAGRYTQANQGVAIGSGAGQGTTTAGTGQGLNSVAIGASSGSSTQGDNSVAIGTFAGRYNQGASSVAIGYQAAGVSAQGTNSVAIGIYSGETAQGNYAVAIGPQAGRTSQHANSIVLNATSSILNSRAANTFCVKPIRANTASTNLLGYDTTTGEITSGATASVAPSSLLPITLDNTNNRVGINRLSPTSTLDVAGNINASWDPYTTSVAVGANAGWGGGTDVKQVMYDVAVGHNAGKNGQKQYGVAVGASSGQDNQAAYAVAVGTQCGKTNQGTEAIAIGYAGLTDQGRAAVAVGSGTGQTSQGANAIAIGEFAGQLNQGANAIAIGYYAGQNSQAPNSIVINATGTTVNTSTASSFKVKPIRQDTAQTNYVLHYNPTTGEITYGA